LSVIEDKRFGILFMKIIGTSNIIFILFERMRSYSVKKKKKIIFVWIFGWIFQYLKLYRRTVCVITYGDEQDDPLKKCTFILTRWIRSVNILLVLCVSIKTFARMWPSLLFDLPKPSLMYYGYFMRDNTPLDYTNTFRLFNILQRYNITATYNVHRVYGTRITIWSWRNAGLILRIFTYYPNTLKSLFYEIYLDYNTNPLPK
jgi:hypothetical protein